MTAAVPVRTIKATPLAALSAQAGSSADAVVVLGQLGGAAGADAGALAVEVRAHPSWGRGRGEGVCSGMRARSTHTQLAPSPPPLMCTSRPTECSSQGECWYSCSASEGERSSFSWVATPRRVSRGGRARGAEGPVRAPAAAAAVHAPEACSSPPACCPPTHPPCARLGWLRPPRPHHCGRAVWRGELGLGAVG